MAASPKSYAGDSSPSESWGGLSPKYGGGSEGGSWVSPVRKPRPLPLQQASSVQVSRDSGLRRGKGTFGDTERFSSKVSPGNHSPSAENFYKRNQLYKLPHESSSAVCSLGVGDRPGAELPGPRDVGPGSYDIVASVAQQRSPLDGPEFCTMTLKPKLNSTLIPHAMISPGPHHRYEIRGPLDQHCPKYALPLLGHGRRSPEVEDRDHPGPGHYFGDFKSVASSSSCPNLADRGNIEPPGGTKRFVKTTFGTSERFKSVGKNCSPKEELYYAHSKFQTSEDYLKQARSCSFGKDNKTDFSNPHRGHRSDTSPVSYSPNRSYGAAMKSSPMDGFVSRCTSPVHSFSKGLGTGRSRDHGDLGFNCSRGSDFSWSTPASPARSLMGAKGGAEAGDSSPAAAP